MLAYGIISILGRLAFLLALLAFALAVGGKAWAGRANSMLLATAILVGTAHYFLNHPRSVAADQGAAILSFLLTAALFWRLIRGQGR